MKNQEKLSKIASIVSDRSYNLIVMPTEKCNFRCTYCYEDYSVGRMSPETIQGVKTYIERRMSDSDSFYLSWFGGEPLVARDIVLEISAHAAEMARKYTSVKYLGGMTTNGYYLTTSTLADLASVGILDYQISLDGPREVHNKTRVRADGVGTFDRIWENLLAARDSNIPFDITLRCHFDAESHEELLSLFYDIRKEFLHDKRFRIYFKSIEKLGGKNDDMLKIAERKEKEKILASLKSLVNDNERIVSKQEHSVCYASRPNSLVVRADGSLAKCTVAFQDPRNSVGTLQQDGTLKIHQDRLGKWFKGLETLDEDMLSCPWSKLATEPHDLV